ncbi:MAG: hypothetical protein ACRDQA_32015 [Nocardioidaceae bacterium]
MSPLPEPVRSRPAFQWLTPPVIPDPLRPVTFYLHLDSDVFCGLKPGVARHTGEGPISLQQARENLGHPNVVIKPVIDLAHMTPAGNWGKIVWARASVNFPKGSMNRATAGGSAPAMVGEYHAAHL